MKQSTLADIQRLEKKINLLNDKLDRLMEAQGVELKKTPEEVDKEAEKQRKARERQQSKIMMKENIRRRIDRMIEDGRFQNQFGHALRREFNLLNMPSADRIREYQRTKDPKAFNGLKRNGQ